MNEDVLDHVNELCEHPELVSGFMGTGWQSLEKVEIEDELSEHCLEAHGSLLTTTPRSNPNDQHGCFDHYRTVRSGWCSMEYQVEVPVLALCP